MVHRLALRARVRAAARLRDRARLRGSGAGQLVALVGGRYAPYPTPRATAPRPGSARLARRRSRRARAVARHSDARARAAPAPAACRRPAGAALPARPPPSRIQRTREPAASSPSPRGTCTSASAAAARAIMCDSWPDSGSSTTPSRSRRDRARTNSSRRVVSLQRPPRARRTRAVAADRAAPCSARSAGLTKQLAADERRHRVARQPEHERLTAHAERHRLARLDRDAPEHLLDTELRLDRAHEVVRTDRDAARRDEDVRREPAFERRAVRGLVVGDGRQRLDVGAGGGERGREHERRSTRRSDRARASSPGRASSLPVARIATRGRRAHATAATPAAARAPSCAGPRRTPAATTTSPASHVAAARANVRTQRHRFRERRSRCHVGQRTRWG